jgi:hypothetical protein
MKFTTLIPTRLNDGQPIPPRQLRRIMDELTAAFGGCSDEGKTKGQWIDPKDLKKYRDQSVRISVACERAMLEQARAEVIRIGQILWQRAMYFEVRDYDGVQILEIPPTS